MINLIDPAQNASVTVSALNQIQPEEIPCKEHVVSDKTISFEGGHIAETMSKDNFSSSLSMKTRNVKDIHFQMALQQFALQKR
ncbi:hypothetical protein NDK43_21710 [Neobacillus pocheonensis]|uniref:Uncharacterized protein n=1 Tax=Neobacillus pocheonensis TaxID=363869 RepID=A0ABT0WDZ1_9BACI|nr:hypothetical protein [Neobacillus pocheonensis]